jgi:hypothetical protein
LQEQAAYRRSAQRVPQRISGRARHAPQGKSLRTIAVETGASMNTVRRYLAAGELPRCRPHPLRGDKLDPFKDYVVKRAEAARPYWIPATMICFVAISAATIRVWSGRSQAIKGTDDMTLMRRSKTGCD